MKNKTMLLLAFSFIFCSHFAFTHSAKLDMQEVNVLKEIWGKLGLTRKTKLDFDKDPCSVKEVLFAYVICDCSFQRNTTCHVTDIFLRLQNISTTLPPEFAKLGYLTSLELSYNYLSGTIPSEWATMRLGYLSLRGNQLSGSFPVALTRMTSLYLLDVERNRFSGPIPEEIANLINLERLTLSANSFTGHLPVGLAKLTNLTILTISDNNFTGKIPDFISQWTKLQTLHVQGCSFEGPLPSSISALTQLNHLRISDLKGTASTFPSLEKMTQLNILVLRNCLIHGTIPDYVGDLRSLITLDLSFNNLTGKIPSSLFKLESAENIFLTKNNLTGPMPHWVLSSTKNVDVSYNQLTWDDASSPKKCDEGTVNIVESYSSTTDKHIPPCLRKDFPCTKSKAQQIHSLHINCGDNEVIINNTIKYEADVEKRGASTYYNGGNWAFSSTGNFLVQDYGVYIRSNTSSLHNISGFDIELYRKARTAAISLTYYGLCLMNGNYTVRLHFAEIVFTQDHSFNSFGKRVFDVYVQDELKLKDFDIVKEAGGTGRAVIKTYTVNVKNNTLKINLYWAGKGTSMIPDYASYGPIISAISVDPNFKPPGFNSD